jgi:CheY-like chemotaxis protein
MANKILIIDDDTDVILILSTVLRDQGYDVITAEDGIKGLDMVKRERPDLILLDLMMPEKSGISLLQDIKEDKNLKDIPVIMVTGVSSETGIDLESFLRRSSEKADETQAPRPDGYIQKPIDPVKLIHVIKEFLI